MDPRLERLVDQLARRRVFLTYTDHLTDDALIALLLEVIADRAPPGLVAIPGDAHTMLPCLDFDTELETFLAMYANDAFRASWAESWPDDHVPPRRPLLANRDAFLPGPSSDDQALAA